MKNANANLENIMGPWFAPSVTKKFPKKIDNFIHKLAKKEMNFLINKKILLLSDALTDKLKQLSTCT